MDIVHLDRVQLVRCAGYCFTIVNNFIENNKYIGHIVNGEWFVCLRGTFQWQTINTE